VQSAREAAVTLPAAVRFLGLVPDGDATGDGLVPDGDVTGNGLAPDGGKGTADHAGCNEGSGGSEDGSFWRSLAAGRLAPPALPPADPVLPLAVLEFALLEGRNRQVRRLCARSGLAVLSLTRCSLGPLALDGLAPGSARALTPAELHACYAAAFGHGHGTRVGVPRIVTLPLAAATLDPAVCEEACLRFTLD